jgi:hypothetical protein
MNNLKERNPVPTSIQGSSEDPLGFIYPSYRAAPTETHRDKPSLKGSYEGVAYVSTAIRGSVSTLSFEETTTKNRLGSQVPALPESDSWEGYEGWTAGLVRAVIDAAAQATDEEPEDLLEAATRSARFKAERTKLEAEKVERDLGNMARERLLPDEKTLEKVARYEAHLSRGLYKALHELEVLQTKRQGGSAPLARLDVDGLAES